VLLELGQLRTIDIPWRAPAIVTATPKGARARADLRLPPKLHAPGRLLHDLTVVEIAAWLLEQDQQAGWITERELLRDELSAARDLDGRLRRGPGRRPDGVLVRASGQAEAVEVELTPKRTGRSMTASWPGTWKARLPMRALVCAELDSARAASPHCTRTAAR
jgi:hypothetical protein